MTRVEIIEDLHRMREKHWEETKNLSAKERALETNEQAQEIIKKMGLKVRVRHKALN